MGTPENDTGPIVVLWAPLMGWAEHVVFVDGDSSINQGVSQDRPRFERKRLRVNMTPRFIQ